MNNYLNNNLAISLGCKCTTGKYYQFQVLSYSH